jgi:hypothetical protein
MAAKYARTNRNSLGQFKRSIETMVHVSAPIVRNPRAVIAEAMKSTFAGPQFVVGHGKTYSAGRNAAKRAPCLAAREA